MGLFKLFFEGSQFFFDVTLTIEIEYIFGYYIVIKSKNKQRSD